MGVTRASCRLFNQFYITTQLQLLLVPSRPSLPVTFSAFDQRFTLNQTSAAKEEKKKREKKEEKKKTGQKKRDKKGGRGKKKIVASGCWVLLT